MREQIHMYYMYVCVDAVLIGNFELCTYTEVAVGNTCIISRGRLQNKNTETIFTFLHRKYVVLVYWNL